MDWAQILVVMLAVFFSVFLLLAIVLAVLLIKITRQIKAATSSAQRTVAALEGTMVGFNRAALPLTIARMVIKQVKKATSNKKEGGKHE